MVKKKDNFVSLTDLFSVTERKAANKIIELGGGIDKVDSRLKEIVVTEEKVAQINLDFNKQYTQDYLSGLLKYSPFVKVE